MTAKTSSPEINSFPPSSTARMGCCMERNLHYVSRCIPSRWDGWTGRRPWPAAISYEGRQVRRLTGPKFPVPDPKCRK